MDSNTNLAPGFLVASPKLDGSPFERAVIVMVHHDDEGAMGFIINKPLEIDFGSLLQTARDPLGFEISESCFGTHVHFGGPVRVEQLWLIFQNKNGENEPWTPKQREGLLHFDDHWYLSASSDMIEGFIAGTSPEPFRPFIGYTGWGPGQLEGEIEDGSWLCLGFDEEIVLDRHYEQCWDDALSRIGVNPMAFLMMGKMGMA